jgi:hypothetical protein
VPHEGEQPLQSRAAGRATSSPASALIQIRVAYSAKLSFARSLSKRAVIPGGGPRPAGSTSPAGRCPPAERGAGHFIKYELVQRIAAQNPHLYQRDIENIVNSILPAIMAALARGDRVELRGFGVFSAKDRPVV